MLVKPILVVINSTIYTVLVPVGSVEHDLPLSTHAISVSELVYDLSDETYIKCRGEKTLGDDTIRNLYSMSKPITLGDFMYCVNQEFPRREIE